MSCSVCGRSDPKYRCPGCNRRTCSLQCVRDHKERWGCDGTRNKTKFIPVTKFTDEDLLSDYRLLEETSRLSDRASRDNRHFRAAQHWKRRQQPKLSHLEIQARFRFVSLMRLPKEFSRRQANTSVYSFKIRSILWRVEWKFPFLNVNYVDARLLEDTILSEALSKYIDPMKGDPVLRHRLKPYCKVDEVRVLMKVERCPADQPRYHLLDLMETISNNLKHKSIVEFPTFIVILPSEFAKYPLIGSLGKGTELTLSDMSDSSSGDSSGKCSNNTCTDGTDKITTHPELQDTCGINNPDAQHISAVGPNPDVNMDSLASSVPDAAYEKLHKNDNGLEAFMV